MEEKTFTGCSKMLEDKKLKELQRRVSNYIREGIIKKDKSIEYVDFFLENALKS